METKEAIVEIVLKKLDVAIPKYFQGLDDVQVSTQDDGVVVLTITAGPATITCTFLMESLMLRIRGEATPQGMSSEELDDLGDEIIKEIGNNSRKSCYDDNLTIMEIVLYKDMDEETACKTLYNRVMSFLKVFATFSPRLFGNPEEPKTETFGGKTDMETTGNIEEDPFGFDAIDIADVKASHPEEQIGEKNITDARAKETNEDGLDAEGTSPVAEINPDSAVTGPASQGEPGTDTSSVMGAIIAGMMGNEPSVREKQPPREKAPARNTRPRPAQAQPVVSPIGKEEATSPSASELKQLLDEMANDDTSEDVLDISQVSTPETTDILQSYDSYHGSDPHGLIQSTRDYKKQANEALQSIHDLLASLYLPIYQQSVLLYQREEKVADAERKVWQTKHDLESWRKRLEETRSKLMQQQKDLLDEKARANKYLDSVQEQLDDYKVKCRTVQELEERNQALSAEATRAQEIAAQATRRLDAVVSGESDGVISREYVALLQNTVNARDEQVRQMVDKINRYKEAARLFQDAQAKWEADRSAYESRIQDLLSRPEESPRISQADVDQLNAMIAALRREKAEAAAKLQKQEKQYSEMQSQLAKAKEHVQDSDHLFREKEDENQHLRDRVFELQKEADEMRLRAEQAESELTLKKEEPLHDFSAVSEIFDSLGIHLTPVVGENGSMVGASFDGCEIAVDLENTIIFVRKAIKKPTKYVRKVDDLNRTDIRMVYSLSDRDITCRAFYTKMEEIGRQTKEILSTMENFE